MKKLILTLALLLALSTILLPVMAEDVPTIRIGMLTMLNGSEAAMADIETARLQIAFQLTRGGLAAWEQFPNNGENSGSSDVPKVNNEITYFDTLDSMLMALNAGTIDCMEIYETTAQYLIHNNPDLVQVITFRNEAERNAFAEIVLNGMMANDFSFMFLEENADLRDEFNAALASITETEMDQLIREHITAAINGEEVNPVEMPVIDGAETIKVAVTGSLPPMDYVAADGNPAGFNTALLAEISRRMGKNFELVVVDSVGRAAALASGTVDAVFWTRTNSRSNQFFAMDMNEDEKIEGRIALEESMSEKERETFENFDKMIDFFAYGQADMPEGTIITVPYFSDILVPVAVRADLERNSRANN